MTCRDWAASLWPASFRGVPFFVARDEETPGRRVVVHEFPMRDLPFIEDLGEAARRFSVEAYLAADTADRQAQALTAAVTQRGPGTLVLPAHGVITAHAVSATRTRDKDEAGYIAFRIEFVRAGAAGALATVGMLAAQVRAAAGGLPALSAGLIAGMDVAGRPERVATAAADTLFEGLAAFEAVRTTWPVAPAASSAARERIGALAAAAGVRISRATGGDGALADDLYAIASGLAAGMAPAEAVTAFADLAGFSGAGHGPARTPAARLAAAAAEEAARAVRLAAIAAYAEALAGADYADRPSGIAARAAFAERIGAEMARCTGGPDAALYVALSDLRGQVATWLSRLIADLAPVAQVEAPREMPSLWWGWRLYGDPERGAEIVARNRLPHPSHVPGVFEALVT